MTVGELRDFCLSFPGATFDFPFDAETIVFRVGGKIFALAGINANPLKVNLKCDPVLARDLRETFAGIVPGYHMNKEHWNTIDCDSDVSEQRIRWLIGHSYELVASSLPRSRRPG